MHDPDVVAFEIRRPWPRFEKWPAARPGEPRWSVGRLRHKCFEGCAGAPHPAGYNPHPWWRLRSYSPFWTLAGKRVFFPALITVWHREPGGHDSGEVCKHHIKNLDGTWRRSRAWRLHLHHWRIQVLPLQHLRRKLLTRCQWCGGRSTRGNYVNISHSWDGPRGRWWQGEPGLYHYGCSMGFSQSRNCTCDDPNIEGHNGAYGTCVRCGKHYRDRAGWETGRRAEAIAGSPIKGEPWHWPEGLNYRDVKAELEAAGNG